MAVANGNIAIALQEPRRASESAKREAIKNEKKMKKQQKQQQQRMDYKVLAQRR